MKASDDDGYIMAAALAALFAMALVAAAMVSVSGSALARTKRIETAAQNRIAVESAIRMVGSQLAMDPRRRQLEVTDGSASVEVGATPVSLNLSWESARMDVNRAPLEEIEDALATADLEMSFRTAILANVRAAQADGVPISLLDDLDLPNGALACAHQHLTTFGGQTETRQVESAQPTAVGRPAAGAKLRIDAWPANGGLGRTAVILMTGDADDPYLVLDWREYRGDGGDACRTES